MELIMKILLCLIFLLAIAAIGTGAKYYQIYKDPKIKDNVKENYKIALIVLCALCLLVVIIFVVYVLFKKPEVEIGTRPAYGRNKPETSHAKNVSGILYPETIVIERNPGPVKEDIPFSGQGQNSQPVVDVGGHEMPVNPINPPKSEKAPSLPIEIEGHSPVKQGSSKKPVNPINPPKSEKAPSLPIEIEGHSPVKQGSSKKPVNPINPPKSEKAGNSPSLPIETEGHSPVKQGSSKKPESTILSKFNKSLYQEVINVSPPLFSQGTLPDIPIYEKGSTPFVTLPDQPQPKTVTLPEPDKPPVSFKRTNKRSAVRVKSQPEVQQQKRNIFGRFRANKKQNLSSIKK